MPPTTKQHHQHQKGAFCSIRSVTTLCHLLKTDRRKLHLTAQQPKYKTFTIPKKDGGERKIEDPSADLKRLLHQLNRYLSSVYYFEKSRAAYGFIAGVRNDDDRRNVLTNARKHTGKPYLLNVDLKDFFHTVTRDKVVEIFAGKPFGFKRAIPELLADLTTYQGRLPMGSPTSPVLSNLACRALDDSLTQYAQSAGWAYTRYADDMTFSSKQPITVEQVERVRIIVHNAGFTINDKKVQVFGPEEDKVVTGLVVTDKVDLAPGFLPLLKGEIQQLHDIFRVQNEQGRLYTKWVEKFKQQVQGRLSFASFVSDKNDLTIQTLKDAFYTAINPPEEEFGAISWRGFPYNL